MKIYLPDFHIVEKRKASAESIIVRCLNTVYSLLLTTDLQFILYTQNIKRVFLGLLYSIYPYFNSVERYFPFENRKYHLHRRDNNLIVIDQTKVFGILCKNQYDAIPQASLIFIFEFI